jgi:hypothetical protein
MHANLEEPKSMEKLEAYRKGVAELGNVSAETLSAHIEQTYGIEIAPNFIPLYRASLQEWERFNQKRQAANAHPAPAVNG